MANEDDLEQWARDFPDSRLAKLIDRDSLAKSLYSAAAVGSKDAIKCRRCGQENPMIWQRQTRSADESMTVFFLCRNSVCGARWRE